MRSVKLSHLAAAAAVLLIASTAQAQNKAALDKIVQLNKAALEDFDTLEFDSAKKNLAQALDVAKKNKLEKHPATARTYVHLGVVYVTGFKDKTKGQEMFAAALGIQPTITIEKSLLTGELSQIFDAAKSGGKPKAASTTRSTGPALKTAPEPAPEETRKDDEPDLPAQIEALDCPFPDEAVLGKDVALRCAAAPALNVSKVILFYRPQGKEEFLPLMMEVSRKGWWTATIPGREVQGRSVQFYFEARNAGDKPVASNGRADSPNPMQIVEKTKRIRTADGKVKTVAKVKPKKNQCEVICEDNPVGSECLECRQHHEDQRGMVKYKYWVGFGAGETVGLVVGDPEVREDLAGSFNKGISFDFTSFHLAPEFGIKLSPRFAISIQGRNQFIFQNRTKYGDRVAYGAHAVLARMMLFLNPPPISEDPDEPPPPPNPMQWYVAGLIGGGEGFRLTFVPDSDLPDMKDTTLGGPVVFGGALGFMHELTPGFGWTAAANLLFGAPKFNVAMDVNVGLFFGFGSAEKKKISEEEEPSGGSSTPTPTPAATPEPTPAAEGGGDEPSPSEPATPPAAAAKDEEDPK